MRTVRVCTRPLPVGTRSMNSVGTISMNSVGTISMNSVVRYLCTLQGTSFTHPTIHEHTNAHAYTAATSLPLCAMKETVELPLWRKLLVHAIYRVYDDNSTLISLLSQETEAAQ